MEDKTRMVTLHKLNSGEDIVWLIELDGVNTNVGFTLTDDFDGNQTDVLDEMVKMLDSQLITADYILTDVEKSNLQKIIHCIT